MKRSLSVFICVVMLITNLLPLLTFAGEAGVSCGDGLTWSFNESSGVLTVSGNGEMYDYESGANYTNAGPWSEYSSDITEVIIGDGVTSIGEYAFYGCENLEDVDLGNSVESIGRYAFCDTQVWSIWMPLSVRYIGPLSFPVSDWTHLSIRYGGTEEQWETVKFDFNSYDRAYTIIKFVYENAYRGGCGDDLNWRLDGKTGVFEITGSGDMYNYSLYSVDMPWYGYSIKKMVVGDGVTSIGKDAFFSDSSIEEVVLGNSVKSIGYEAFYKCTSLKQITLPASLKTVNESAFEGCHALEEIHYGGTPAQWNNINIASSNYPLEEAVIHYSYDPTEGKCGDTLEWSFDEDSRLLTLTGNGAMYDYSTDGAPWSHLKPVIKTLCIENGITYIGENAFMGCDALESVKYIGTSDEWRDVEVGKYNDSLETADVESCIVKDYCGEDIIWYFNTFTGELSFEGSGMMPDYESYPNRPPWRKYSDYILTVKISDSITQIGEYAFYGLNNVESIELGESVEVIGESAFEECFALENVDIPASLKTIGDYAFSSCEKLVSVRFGESVEYIGECAFYECTSLESAELPESLTCIEDYAFIMCSALAYINIPDSVTYIGEDAVYETAYYNDESNREEDGALYIGNHFIEGPEDFIGTYSIKEGTLTVAGIPFWGVESLDAVYFPASVIYISDSIFSYCGPFSFICHNGSYAHRYAEENGIPYDFKCDHVYTDYQSNNDATCVTDGTVTAYCDNGCGMSVTLPDEGSATGIHAYGDWYYTFRPTYLNGGIEARKCIYCDAYESREVDKLTLELDTDNFTFTLNCAEHIKDMRYAEGVYKTPSEIKAAEGDVALSNKVVGNNSKDGIFTYRMPTGGYYTLWVRMTNGDEYILPLDLTGITPYVSSNGVTMTLYDLYNVKDFFIAKGEFDSYKDIKANGYIVRVTENKLVEKQLYSYTVAESGVHTVLVRCKDGKEYFLYEDLTVTEPVFSAEGMHLTVSNLTDVKMIRTAYGEWNTVKELKATDTIRNYTAKEYIKGRDSFTLKFENEGVVTVVVEYNNGYKKVFCYEAKNT